MDKTPAKFTEQRKGIRAKTAGFIETIFSIFTGRDSRKVAIGVWGFWMATYLINRDKISEMIWWWVFLVSVLIIGFGTIADRIVDKFGDAVVDLVRFFIAARTGNMDAYNKPKNDTTIPITPEPAKPSDVDTGAPQ